MEKIKDQIRKDLNSTEVIEKFKRLGLEKGIKYKTIEFQEVNIQNDKITIKIKTT